MKKTIISITLLLIAAAAAAVAVFLHKTDSPGSTPAQAPSGVSYALRQKNSGALYPLQQNQSAAYTEFYQLDGMEIHSTDGRIEIPYTDRLEQDYVLYDYENRREIPISRELNEKDVYCRSGMLIIVSAARSSQSP